MLDNQKRTELRQILSGKECVHPGSVYDTISARIAENLGFEMGMFAGSIASAVILGAPDYIVLTLTEFATQARRICRGTNLPILVDADHGYGNALNVKRTVEELENAGVAALTIEDTLLPRSFGNGAATLISIDEGIGKMKSALSGRTDPGLVIAGRTSAVQISGTNEAIIRAQAYEAAGVDALFFTGITTRNQLKEVSESTRLPIMLGTLSEELNDRKYLSSMGVRIALQGHLPYMAGVKAVHDTLKKLRSGLTPNSLSKDKEYDEMMKNVTTEDNYNSWISEFMT